MAFTAENELEVRRHLATMVGNVPSAGYIIPSARYHSGIEDFWASVSSMKTTRDDVERSLIAATWIYPVSFLDIDNTGICPDKPVIHVTYEFYIFRQYGMERLDESETPDVFDSKVLKQEALFNEAWWGIKAEFQRNANIPGVDGFITKKTKPVTMPEDASTQAVCEFIPMAVGYALRLRETVEIKEL